MPAVASPGARAARDRHAAGRRGDQRVVALEHDERLRARRRLARVTQPRALDLLRSRARAAARARRCAGSGPSASAAAATTSSRCPASAFSPSASITSGTSIRGTTPRASACASGSFDSPGPEHDGVGAADRLQHRLLARRVQVAVAVLGQPDHHRLQQSHREAQLEAGGRADRHVARARAHRGQRGHARRARQPARAADDEDVAARRTSSRPTPRRGMSRSTPAPISPASGRAGPPRGMPMSIDLDLARVLLAGPDPQPELGPVERRGRDAVHRRARRPRRSWRRRRTGCRRRSRAPARPPSPRSPGPRARAASPSCRCRAARRRSRAPC